MKLTRDLREFIELLNAQKVDYLVVGGWAFAFHVLRDIRATLIFFSGATMQMRSAWNLSCKSSGLKLWKGSRRVFFSVTAFFSSGLPPNRIDILTKIDGVEFEEAWRDRVPGKLDGITVPFISREWLIRNNEAAGRAKDVADVEALRKTKAK